MDNGRFMPVLVSIFVTTCLVLLALSSITDLAGFLTNLSQRLLDNFDFVLLVILLTIHVLANIASIKAAKDNASCTPPDDKKFVASSMAEASTAGITAVSVLISAAFVIVQIANQTEVKELPPQTKSSVFRAAIYFFLSMFMGLFLKYVIPMRARANVAIVYAVVLPFGFQLIFLVVGILNLVIGFFHLMYP
jgi:hypothetical protein